MTIKKPEVSIHARIIAASTAWIVLALVVSVLVRQFGGTSAFAKQQGRDEIRIELTSNGFAPTEVQHAPGIFAIAVENSKLTEVNHPQWMCTIVVQ